MWPSSGAGTTSSSSTARRPGDARIIGSKADTTLFILRSGLLERSLLPDIDVIYRSGEYGSLCCVLNGTDRRNGYYGHYGHYGAKSGSYYADPDGK